MWKVFERSVSELTYNCLGNYCTNRVKKEDGPFCPIHSWSDVLGDDRIG